MTCSRVKFYLLLVSIDPQFLNVPLGYFYSRIVIMYVTSIHFIKPQLMLHYVHPTDKTDSRSNVCDLHSEDA
jgi:hypothetical protein